MLTTFKSDGTPVSTPVNLAVVGNHGYFRTYQESGKFRRLLRRHHVRIAPSSARGQVTGPTIAASARLLTGNEAERAATFVDADHPYFQGILVRVIHRLRGYTTCYFELTPAEPQAREDASSAG
jgi:PPOX class probable F420-dependent enzyme